MREVRLTAMITTDPERAFRLLSDFAEYPRFMPSVRSVDVRQRSADGCISSWEVTFREGVLKWVERDRLDPRRLRIEFEQIEGDLLAFQGAWQVDAAGGENACAHFSSTFDLGIPSLATFLEPIAQDALIENISNIIRGLFGAESRIALPSARTAAE